MTSSQGMTASLGVGKRLAAIRAKSGLSQAEFADRLGLAKRAYQGYEREERDPPLDIIEPLYRQFGVHPLWLVSGGEEFPEAALNAEECGRLSSDLFGQWLRLTEGLPVPMSVDMQIGLYRGFSRRTFVESEVPTEDLARMIKDLKA